MLTGFEDKVRVLVTAKAKHIAEKRIEQIRKAVVNLTSIWRKQIRESLSVPWPGRKMDYPEGSFPYMRSKMLRASVPRYKISSRKTASGSKLNLGQTVIYMKRIDMKHPWDSYGEILNNRSDGLGGWKDRAYEALSDIITQRLRSATDITQI